jgi:hypothetical protein
MNQKALSRDVGTLSGCARLVNSSTSAAKVTIRRAGREATSVEREVITTSVPNNG